MANRTYKELRLRLDTTAISTGALTDITAYVNQANLQRSMGLLEDTGLSEANKSVLMGLAGTTMSVGLRSLVSTKPVTLTTALRSPSMMISGVTVLAMIGS